METCVSVWSSAVEVGIPEIDAQHRELFDLAASFRGNGNEIRVMKSLVMLCDYAKVHLSEEEDMLVKIGYPEIAAHRSAHGEFRRMLRQLLEDARGLSLDQIADRVEALINGWFYNHVMHVDRDYVPMVIADKKYRSERLDACRTNLAASAKREDTGSPD
jgi:hemerythrin